MTSKREPFNGERTIVDQTCEILNDIVLGRACFVLTCSFNASMVIHLLDL